MSESLAPRPPDWRNAAMTRGARYAVIFLFVLSFVLAGGSYLLSAHAISQSQHKWCNTLTLLTRTHVPRPADAAANPSRENAYLFYMRLVKLRNDFGC